ALKSVVRGDAAGQGQETAEPRLTLLGEQGDIGPVVAVGDDAAQGHDEQVDEAVFGAALDAGVQESAEMFLDRGHGSLSSHAFLRGGAKVRRILWLYTCRDQAR